MTVTYPIDLELADSDQPLVQWRSSDDQLVHEYRIAVRDRDALDTDLGCFAVPSTQRDGLQTYSQAWLGAPIEPGKRYYLDVWAHDRVGNAIKRAGRQYFHMVHANGCYKNVG